MIYAVLAVMGAVAGFVVWRLAERAWDYAAIAVLALASFPLLAMGPTGDMSRHIPSAFSDGPQGVGEIMVASALGTLFVAVILAAVAWRVLRVLWRRSA